MSGERKQEPGRQEEKVCILRCVTCGFISRLFKGWGARLIKRPVSQPIYPKTVAGMQFNPMDSGGKRLESEFTSLHFARTFMRSNLVVGYRLLNAVGRIVVCAFCLLFPVNGYAEELPDPTRPPTSITLPAPIAGSAPAGLQSIIVSKSRRAAIIDGETVELGGKHGDATLIEVGENSVVLQGAQGRQVLTLFPDVKIMQRDIQAAPKLSVKEGGVARITKLKARKERK